jgi:hypothetical protein
MGLILGACAVAYRRARNNVFKLLVADLKLKRLAFVGLVLTFWLVVIPFVPCSLFDQDQAGFLLEEVHLGFAEVKHFRLALFFLYVRDCLLDAG